MTEKKHHRISKGWLAVAIAAIVLLCTVFTANAVTDGAVFDGRLLHGLRLVFDGKEFTLDDYEVAVYTTTDKNGETVVRHEYAAPNGAEIYADVAEDYTAFSLDSDESNEEIRIKAPEQTESAE